MMIITRKCKKTNSHSALSRIGSTLHPHISGHMKPFYKHMALGFRSTYTYTHRHVSKQRISHKEHEWAAVNHRLVTAMDTGIALRYKDHKHSTHVITMPFSLHKTLKQMALPVSESAECETVSQVTHIFRT